MQLKCIYTFVYAIPKKYQNSLIIPQKYQNCIINSINYIINLKII